MAPLVRCPACNLPYAIVGRAHRCIPRPAPIAAPVEAVTTIPSESNEDWPSSTDTGSAAVLRVGALPAEGRHGVRAIGARSSIGGYPSRCAGHRGIPIRNVCDAARRMRPLAYHRDLCAREFVAGKRYRLIQFDERSRDTHDHFFAIVSGYWHNWPESYERELPSPDHLRKHALIRTGHYIQSVMAHASTEAAAAYVRDFLRYVDYAEGSIAGPTTVMRIAKTQRKKVMEADEFQRSKTDVFDFCQAATGIAPEDMAREVKKGATA